MAETHTRREPIAIVGSACRFPGPASSPSKLWEFLQAPFDISTEIPPSRFNVDGFYHPVGSHHGTSNTRRSYFMEEDHRLFDAAFFQIHPREAETMDPQQRLLLETVFEGLESAGMTIEGMQGSQTSVFVGGMSYDFRDSTSIRDPASIPEYAATGTHASILAARISYFFDWKGPCMSIDTACSSSLVAVHQAVQTLRNGDATVAIAAGSNLILGPEQYIALSNLQMLSPNGHIRMWDSEADGYARGEGFGAVMLKTLSQALQDGDHIECVIRETGVGQDGKTTGITMPSATAQTALIRKTYERAGLDLRKESDRPQYFEAHGTGTPAGDPIEAEAIYEAFFGVTRELSSSADSEHSPLFVGSVKTVIGHLEGAAGIAGLLKASCAIQNAVIPPNLHFNTLNPKIAPFYGQIQIPTTKQAWPDTMSGSPRRASINSFGFGGTNAHVIIENFEKPPATAILKAPTEGLITPLIISAKSERSLVSCTQAIAKYIEANPQIDLEDLAYTLQSRRSHFQYRLAIGGLSRDQVLAQIEKTLQTPNPTLGFRAQVSTSRLLGVFTGQGAQYSMMGREIIERSPVAAGIISSLESSLATLSDPPKWSIKQELLAPTSTSRLGEAAFSQPLCTAIQIVLVDLLQLAGVSFDTVVGHSSGEIGAAYAAGYISAFDAIRIAYYRGLHASLAGGEGGTKGAMMAVGLCFEDAEVFCSKSQFRGRISVAASNSPSSCTFSGDSDAIDEARILLEGRKVFSRRLIVDTAYHSHHMRNCSEPYLRSLLQCGITVMPDGGRECKWISSVYGSRELAGLEGTYWVDNMTEPVLFAQAVDKAVARCAPFDIAIEVGPHPALKGPTSETLVASTLSNEKSMPISYIGTLERKKDSIEALSTNLGQVWERKRPSSVDFETYRNAFQGFENKRPRLLKGLPAYSWDHQQVFYRESRLSSRYRSRSAPHNDLLGTREPSDSDHEMRWRNILSFKEMPLLRDHKLQGQAVVPAMWYVVMALEGARALCSAHAIQCIEILDFEVIKAITLEEGSTSETIITIRHNTQDSERDAIVLSVSCSSGGHLADLSLDSTFEGKVIVHLEDMQLDTIPPMFNDPEPMVGVDVDGFYTHLEDTGYQYSGLFRGLNSIFKRGHTSTATATTLDTDYFIHPAILDLGLQNLLAAFHSLNDGHFSPLLVPRRISRLLFNTRSNQGRRHGSKLSCHSVVLDHSHSGMSGDIDIINEDGQLEVQIENVSWAPLTAMQPSDDRKLFSTTVWKPDVLSPAPIDAPEYSMQEQNLVAVCDRVAWYYYRSLKQNITPDELDNCEWHHRRLFSYIDYLLPQLSAGRVPTVKPEWENDTHENILSVVEQHPNSADLQLILAVGKNLPTAIRERRTMLEFMMEGNKLNHYYQFGLGYQKSYSILETMVERIAHRYPRMKLLEVGAGTGGATGHVLQALQNDFLSYTFTDVSSGFFEKAQEQFRDYTQKMLFKTFDLERDPTEQGYQKHSYDLVIGSLVIHATKSLSTTLSYVRSLLKPGGFLLLVEGSESTLRSGFMMCGLPGWWVGGDDRQWGPMISPERWDVLLRQNGFSGIDRIVHDSDLPFVNLGGVFISQAVDKSVNFLRGPLASTDLPLQQISVLGGSSSETASIVDSLSTILTNIATVQFHAKSVHTSELSNLPYGNPILCLVELDDPIFKNFTRPKHQGLQKMFVQADRILFVTRTNGPDYPYSSILLGLVRSLRLEAPHLRIQILGIRGENVDVKFIAETFLRLVHVLPTTTGEMLSSFEPEIESGDGILSIPRVVQDTLPNNRLNSRGRHITESINPGVTSVEVLLENSSYALQRRKVGLGSPTSPVTVTHSTLQKIQVGDSRFYICLGYLSSTRKQIIALSEYQASIITPASSMCFEASVEIGKEAHCLYLLSCQLVAQGLLPNGSVLIHEGDPVLCEIFSKEARRCGGHTKVTFSSSKRTDASGGSPLHIHPHATQRSIRQTLARVPIQTFIDCSQDNLSSKITACFQDVTCVDPFPNEHCSGNAKFGAQVNLTESCLQSLPSIIDCSVRRYEDFLQERTISISKVPGMKPNSQSLHIIDWAQENPLPVEVTTIMDSFTLFSKNKTYLLVGLTGTMGRSLCQWMVTQGARYIVLASRNPQSDQEWNEKMSSTGATVKISALNITNREDLDRLYHEIAIQLPPIGGVVNGAMVLRDGAFQGMTYEAMDECLGPKVDGSRHLDGLFADTPLEFFIMFSSIAWVVGNPGQSNYSAANGFMAALASARRKRGLAASTMSIGVVSGVGYLARTKGGQEHEHAKRRNVMTISAEELQTVFAEAIIAGRPDSNHSSELIAGLDGSINTGTTPRESLSAWLADPRVSRLVTDKNDQLSQQSVTVKANMVPLKQQLSSSGSHNESLATMTTAFLAKIERMLLLETGSVVDSSSLADMGVDSLLAVEIRSWFLVELKVDVPILKILGGATVAELSSIVLTKLQEQDNAGGVTESTPGEIGSQGEDSASSVEESYTPLTDAESSRANRSEPMSFAQARMWRVHQHTAAARVNNLSWAYRIEGPVDNARFEKAFATTVDLYESLRTCFFNDESSGQPMQEIMARSKAHLLIKTVSSEEEVDLEFERVNNFRYDLPSGNTMNASFLSLTPSSHVFIGGFHHIVLDTRSIEIFLADLDRAYRQLEVKAAPAQPADYAVLEKTAIETGAWSDSQAFWRQQHISHPDILPLFPFSQVKERQTMTEYRLRCVRYDLNSVTATAIKRVCKTLKISPYHLHTAVFQVLLHRTLNISDICIGSVDANRTEHTYRDVFGPLFNYLPIRFLIDSSSSFQELALETRKICYAAQGHAQYPFDQILDDLETERMPATHHPLYQAQMNYLRHTIEEVPFGPRDLGMSLRERNSSGVDVSYDFCVSVLETGGGEGARVLFHAQEYLYGTKELEELAATYMRILEECLSDTKSPVGSVDVGAVTARSEA